MTSRLDRIESTYVARLDQLGQRSDPNAAARLADLSARLDALEKKAAAGAEFRRSDRTRTKLEKLEKKVAVATPSAKELSDLATRDSTKLEKRTIAGTRRSRKARRGRWVETRDPGGEGAAARPEWRPAIRGRETCLAGLQRLGRSGWLRGRREPLRLTGSRARRFHSGGRSRAAHRETGRRLVRASPATA